jgi:hypothetical protein
MILHGWIFLGRNLHQAVNNHPDFVRSDLPSWFGSRSHGEVCSMCRIKKIFDFSAMQIAMVEWVRRYRMCELGSDSGVR